MPSLQDVYINVLPRLDEAHLTRELRRVDGNRHGRRVGDDFSRGMSSSFRGIASGLAGAFAAIGVGNLLKGFITDAAESAKISRITANAIQATGGAAKVTAADVDTLVKSLSNQTAVDDELIQQGANLLLTFKNIRNEAGAGNKVFDQATAAAVDLAAAGFGTVETASIQLGKALNDPIKGITALGRSGVTFTEQQKEQIKTLTESGDVLGAQKIILAEISAQVGGAATAAADPLDRLRVVGGNLGETIGGVLLPYVERFAVYATDHLIPAVEKFIDEFESGEGAGGRLADVFDTIHDKASVAFAFFREEVLPRLKEFGSAVASGDGERLGEIFASIRESAAKLAPAVGAFLEQLPSMTQLAAAAAGALRFLADHVDTIVKFMPLIVAGFVLWRASQVAATAAAVAALPVRAAEVAAMVIQGRANAALAFQLGVLTGVQRQSMFATIAHSVASRANAVATGIQSTATAIYTGITSRATIMAQLSALATYGQSTAFGTLTLAQKVAVVWTKAITAAQWLWNAAMTANPIGIVVVALAAFAGALVYAYNHSETFRNIVDKTWLAVRTGITIAWEQYIKPAIAALVGAVIGAWQRFQLFRDVVSSVWAIVKAKVREGVLNVVNAFLDMAEKVLDAADSAFGWIPGLGDQLDDARSAFNTFRDGVNAALGGIKDRTVSVAADATLKASRGIRVPLAAGGPVHGPGTATSDSIPALLSNGEHVWTAKEVASAGGHAAVEAMRAGVLRRAKGGRVEVVARTSGLPEFQAAAKAFDDRFGKAVAKSLAGIVLDGAGRPTPGNGAGSQANLVAFGRMLQRLRLPGQTQPIRVSEHPQFGGVDAVHTRNSRHYSGRAIDVNAAAGTSAYEQRILDMVVPMARAYGLRTIWRQKGHFNHAHFDYDTGGFMYPGQTGANRGRKPERVLSGDQTESFERFVNWLERGGLNPGGAGVTYNGPVYAFDPDAWARRQVAMMRDAAVVNGLS